MAAKMVKAKLSDDDASVTRVRIFVSLAYWAAVIGFLAVSAASFSATQLFVLFIYAAMYFLVLLSSMDFFAGVAARHIFKTDFLHLLGFAIASSLPMGFLLEAATVSGTPGASLFQPDDWSKKRFVIFMLIGYGLVYGCLRLYVLNNQEDLIRRVLSEAKLFQSRALGVAILLSFGAALLLSAYLGHGFWLTFGLMVCVVVSFFALCRRVGGQAVNLETIFAVVALLFGVFVCVALPTTTGITWDDQIHYKSALEVSYVTNPSMTDTELYLSEIAPRRAVGEDVLSISDWSNGSAAEDAQELNERYSRDVREGRVTDSPRVLPGLAMTSIGYAPSAVGLWLGRLLHVSLSTMVIMGRIANLLAYVVGFYIAIKNAPCKKLIFFVVGLIPTGWFLACNYSYDSWITALIASGIALFMREMCNEDKCLNQKAIALSLALMVAGIMVKAVYCPILGLYFLMPSNKFKSSKQRTAYYFAVISIGLFLASSFALPFLSSGGEGSSDVRGGSDVNSAAQLAFIIGNPIRFVQVLALFLFGSYFNPLNASYLVNFAYLGRLGEGFVGFLSDACNLIPVFFLVIVGLSEKEFPNGVARGLKTRLWTIFTFLLSFVLVAASLYITFTPVGSETINGVQGRYLIPWLAPILIFVLNNKRFSSLIRKRFPRYEMAYCSISIAALAISTVLFVVAKFF